MAGVGPAAWGVPQAAASQTAQTPEADKVVSYRVVREDGSVLLENPANLPIQIGKSLDADEVAQSIRYLYRQGNYADIRAEAKFVPGGAQIDFVVKENLFFNQVIIEGLKAPPSDATAAASMQLSLGQTFYEADLKDGIARLEDLLRDEGLYQAKVTTKKEGNEENHELNVIVTVEPGERVRVGEITLVNNSQFTRNELLSRLKLNSGSQLTMARLQQATDRIRKFLEKKGFLSARVSVRRGEYDSTANTVPLTLDVNQGPMVKVVVTGVKFSHSDVRKLVPVYQEGSVDADLLEEGKRNIMERLQREGYFDATVDYAVARDQLPDGGAAKKEYEETITYAVNRGAKHKILRVEIVGNRYFSAELLRSRLALLPNGTCVKTRFSKRVLEADVASMRNLYLSNGFQSARVEGQVFDDFAGKTGDIVIRFDVQEGKQTLVSSVEIQGAAAISKEVLESVMGSLPGQPYSDINVSTDRDNILALYYNDGFPTATFSWRAVPDESADAEARAERALNAEADKETAEHHTKRAERSLPMKLFITIHEGSQVTVGRIFLTGYVHTREGVVRRDVLMKPEQPLREGQIIETQQKLYNLGIFNRVSIAPQNANGANPVKDVVVEVEEAKRYTIAYGGGFEVQRLASTTSPTGGEVSASPRGIFEVSKLNLTGRADSLTFKARGSTIQWRTLLAYNLPNTFANQKLSLQATAYAEQTQDINTFSQQRYEANLQFTQELTTRSNFLYRYAFRKVTVSNLNIPSEEVPLFNQPTLISQFSTTWFRDTRNNPADATKGTFNSVDVGVASTAIGSSASFARLFIQSTRYTPISRSWGLANSIRVGILEPFGDTQTLTFPAQTGPEVPVLIPLPERLYAGGGASLRGFALNQAGPRDSITGFPVGGQALIIFNQELRFPLHIPFICTKLGGAFFYDGGNTYSQLSHVSLRWKTAEPVFKLAYPDKAFSRFNPMQCVQNCTNELNYFSHTVGFGLRYPTPIGPIRVDFGYLLNRPLFVIPCKNNAPLCQQGTRLPGFQFFINLGSSF